MQMLKEEVGVVIGWLNRGASPPTTALCRHAIKQLITTARVAR